MRKLTHSADDARGQERRISRMVPVLACTVAVAMALTIGAPTKSDAEQPRRAELCSASVETGRIASFTSTTRTSRLFRTPLLESNRYLQVSMPNAYMDQVGQAAAARPEPERQSFIADVMQKNVSAALTALGSNRSAAFECAAPVPTQPAAPTVAPPAPAPAPAQDGGAEEPAQRRRVIQPGAPSAPGGKATPAPKQNPPATAVQAPIAPARKGGKGTDAEPYVVEIPVPSKRAGGTELYREKFSYLLTDANVSEKLYVSLRFVAASGTVVTSKERLVGQITPIITLLMKDALHAKNINDAPASGSLSSSVAAIVVHARKENADVRAYAAES